MTHNSSANAVASLAVNAANVIFAVIYCVLAQRRSLAISLGGTYVVWIVLTAIITPVTGRSVPRF